MRAYDRPKIHISDGNSKLGAIPNISLPPVKACGRDVPCKRDCYALKAYRMYKQTTRAWNDNLKIYRNNSADYWQQIGEYLNRKRPKYFRFHVAGDILDSEYLENMVKLAGSVSTRILCFTKRADLICKHKSQDLPPNLTIIYSAWPRVEIPKTVKSYPIAFMQDGTETRATDAIECPGNCESCGMCWSLKKLGKNVVFHKH